MKAKRKRTISKIKNNINKKYWREWRDLFVPRNYLKRTHYLPWIDYKRPLKIGLRPPYNIIST